MTLKKSPSDLRFSIRTTESNWTGCGTRYLHAEARVLVREDRGDHVEWVHPRPYGSEGTDFAEFLVSAQLDRDSAGDFYGQATHFTHHRQGRTEVEAMVRVFRRLDRKLPELEHRFGYTTDFAGYLARIAVAIGMPETSCFGRYTPTRPDGYAWMDASALRFHLLQQARDWRTQHGYTREAA